MLCILKSIIHKLHYRTNIVKYYNPSNYISATHYGLDGPWIEFWWGGGAVRYPPSVQTDPGAHRVSCTMDTG
jgi:hypothetical protein